MDKMQKVELVREKSGVSYEDAKAALDACDDDVLDAIIWLERAGKAEKRSAHTTTSADAEPKVSAEMVAAQTAYEESTKKSRFSEDMGRLWEWVKRMCRRGMEIKLVADRNGERMITLPLLIVILGLFAWGATLWLLIIGLFFGLRYRLEGMNEVTVRVNDVMDKAADVADSIKRDVQDAQDSHSK